MVHSIDETRSELVLQRHGLGRNVPRSLKSAVERRVRALESDPAGLDRASVELRQRLKKLYAVLHLKPSAEAQLALFGKGAPGSALAAVRALAALRPASSPARAEAAAELARTHRLPYLVVESALGTMPEPVALAVVESIDLDELLSRLVLLSRRGLIKGRVRRALARRLEAAKAAGVPYRKLESVVRRAGLDRELTAKVIGLATDEAGALRGRTAVLVDASASMERVDGELGLASRVIAAIDAALSLDDALDVILFGERTHEVALPRTVAADELAAALGAPWSDLGLGTSAGAAAERLADDVERVVVIGDGTENRAPRLAGVLLDRRARLGRDPAVVLVQPHDAARQLAVDLKEAAIASEVFMIDRYGFGHAALLGALAAQRSVDVLGDILATEPL